MNDAVVIPLANEVWAGRVSSAGPLLDRLAEVGDARGPRLALLLGTLFARAGRLADNLPARIIRRRSPEREAARRDEIQERAWVEFAEEFRRLFWPELAGRPPLEELARLEQVLECPKQAGRWARRGGQDPDEEGPEEGAAVYADFPGRAMKGDG